MLNDIRDRILSARLQRDEKEIKVLFGIIGLVIVSVIAGAAYLFFIFSKNLQTLNESASKPLVQAPTPTPTPLPTPSIEPTASQTLPLQESSVKEYFVPLGSGTNQTSDWTDVPGVQATIDFGKYPNIKEVKFEASVHVPTANQYVYVRLYNVTDKHPVWYSDVSMNSPTALLTSQPIIYDEGEKLYQVQMKTQLKFLANLVQSRIHIILK